MQQNIAFKGLTMLMAIFLYCAGIAQDKKIEIELGPDEIGENQAFTITVTVHNDRLKGYKEFPDIDGFIKRGTSSSSRTNIVNGQISSTQSITMTYAPTEQGTFKLLPFKMVVNGKSASSRGKTIKVGPPVQISRRRQDPFNNFFNRDPFDDFFGRNEPSEFVDIKEDAFLALTTSKNEVYVGEGFTATLSFYVSASNRAPLQFYELGKQLSGILKEVRPSNCWEENFNIENINDESVVINNKRYSQYKLYQGTFYPLNTETIQFPSVGLKMIKYKVAKNPSFFGQNRKEDFKTFNSKPRTVRVKELPPHPLKDVVAVGDYRLDEHITNPKLLTGNSFSYEFNIYGEGNISAIHKPNVKEDKNFDFYDPNITQNINRKNGRVTGAKSFKYYGIPNEPGTYRLKDYFQWPFFNPKTRAYDTLASELVIKISGESKKNESIRSTDLGSFYDRIEFQDNTLTSVGGFEWIKISANIFILTVLVLTAAIIFKK